MFRCLTRLLQTAEPGSSPAVTLLAARLHHATPLCHSQQTSYLIASSTAVRSYVSGFQYLEHGQNGRTRHDQYVEVDTARQLLPHRVNFSPQFSAHGIHLIPLQIGSTAPSAESVLEPLYADSVKRKRRLKMKRHKYKKRMRALKAGNK